MHQEKGRTANLVTWQKEYGSVVKSALIVIDMASVQNLLAPFRDVLRKGTLRHYSLLGSLG